MKGLYRGLGILVFTGLISLVTPAYAQTGAAITRLDATRYDSRREITLAATVADVPGRSPQGLQTRSHLRLETSIGVLHGSLGRFALRGKNSPSVRPGQHLQVTGVIISGSNSNVFLIRTLQVDGHVYAIRDEHGRLIRHSAGDSKTRSESKGGLR